MTDGKDNDMALVTVVGDDSASLEGAAAQLGVGVEDLDREFGVISIDPIQRLYAVHVRADRLPPGFEESPDFRGPFSSPKIDTFGPPEEPGRKKSD